MRHERALRDRAASPLMLHTLSCLTRHASRLTPHASHASCISCLMHLNTSCISCLMRLMPHAPCLMPHASCLMPRAMPHASSRGRTFAMDLHLKKRSEEHTSELQSHSFISYAVFCLKKNT